MMPLQTTRTTTAHYVKPVLRRSRGWLVLEPRTRLASARAMGGRCDLRLSERAGWCCQPLQVP
jgi:hypothetical protein